MEVGRVQQSEPGLEDALNYGHGHDAQALDSAEVVDLRYLFRVWIRWSWVPLLFVLVGLYQGYGDIRDFTPQYVASMIVMPSGSTETSSSLGRLGAVAEGLGIQLGAQPGTVSPFQRMESLLGSLELARAMDVKHGLLHQVYGSLWDEESQAWRRPTGADFERWERIREFFRLNPWTPPSVESLSLFIESIVNVERMEGSVFQRMSVVHADPEFARWLLTTTFAEADDLLRQRDRAEWVERQAFLRQQFQAETNMRMQEAMIQLLSQELGRQIVLDASLPYAATVVEEVYVSEVRTEPNLALVFGVPSVALGAVGFLLVTIVALFRAETRGRG